MHLFNTWVQTRAASEMQQVLHCCSSGCRFSICFADADKLNSSLIGKQRVEHRVWSAQQHPCCLLLTQASSLCNVGAYGKVNFLSKKSPLELSLKREGWGFGENWWCLPKILWLEMTCVGSADFREPAAGAQPGYLEGLSASFSPGWNCKI